MKLSRQQRRQICRTMAERALAVLPYREVRAEHRKSKKLLAKRMFQDAPRHVSDGTIIEPGGVTLT